MAPARSRSERSSSLHALQRAQRPSSARPAQPEQKPRANSDGESDSEYNVWLEKEYYHDPATGQNYWVSPSQDWEQNGPQGPGYYTRNGNDVTKLVSGYAQ